MKHTKLNRYLDKTKKCIDISMYDQAAILLRKCVEYIADQLYLAFAGDAIPPNMFLHEKLLALKSINPPVLTKRQFNVLFQIKDCGSSAAHDGADNSYRTISGNAEGPVPAEVIAGYYSLQAFLQAFYKKVPEPLPKSPYANDEPIQKEPLDLSIRRVQKTSVDSQTPPFEQPKKATSADRDGNLNKADADYGILVPCAGSLKGSVSYLIHKGARLPIMSDSITLYSASGSISLRLYRSGCGQDAGSNDPDACEELIRVPFTVPANSRCHVSLHMETDKKILISCRTEDGTTATKSYR